MIDPKRKRIVPLMQETLPDDRGVNDNIPGLMPGHELGGMGDGPRPATSEAVLHYARISEIPNFPDAQPDAAPDADAGPDIDTVDAATASSPVLHARRVTLASAASLVAHVAVFAILTVAVVTTPEEAIDEAGSVVTVTLLGDSELSALAEGDPDVIEAEPVEPDEIVAEQPPPAEPLPPEIVAPVETQLPAEAIPPLPSLEPETLTALVPAEPFVAEPLPPMMAQTMPPQEVQPVAPVTPQDIQPVEQKPQEITPVDDKVAETPPPETPPVAKKPVKTKPVVKKETAKPKAGSGGPSRVDRIKGAADGSSSDSNASLGAAAAGNRSSSGTADAANYLGKVQGKIARSVRIPSRLKRVDTSVRVRLTIVASGSLGGVSVSRSSGVPDLDDLVLNAVRRAAPFPPLPAAFGGSKTFTQEVQVKSRR